MHALALLATLAAVTSSAPRPKVLVELFTSEGCSSCPPADAALAELSHRQPVEGVELVPLGFHVDYWNYLGWSDPYSRAEYSARQQAYAEALGKDVYTPQMIVDGDAVFVGSAATAEQVAAQARTHEKARIVLTRSPDAGLLHIAIDPLVSATASDPAEVWIAVTEDALSTKVTRGENAGRTLAHAAVVRWIQRVGEVALHGATSLDASVPLDPRWHRANLRAVVFLQTRVHKRVLGVETAPLG